MNFLEMQLGQQRRVYSVDPPTLLGEDRARYVRENVLAAIKELTEVLDCYEWKPWHRGIPAYAMGMSVEPRQHIAEELVDIMKFVFNIALVEGLTDADLEATWDYKARKNAERHEGARM